MENNSTAFGDKVFKNPIGISVLCLSHQTEYGQIWFSDVMFAAHVSMEALEPYKNLSFGKAKGQFLKCFSAEAPIRLFLPSLTNP